jgi:hypothetical protein
MPVLRTTGGLNRALIVTLAVILVSIWAGAGSELPEKGAESEFLKKRDHAVGICEVGTEGGRYSTWAMQCVCSHVSDGRSTPVYAWKNVAAGFSNEAASVGTSTTCPAL